ncbi:MAG: PEP-CTERM sorting domain-containing protein, partial [Verrucomicrobiota bacterium]|nr:PEP-CTERM sorting domain-containing protein [Verrucomicrobiota bacterium]
EGLTYVNDGVYNLEFGFVTETIMNAKITRTSGSDITRSFEIPNVALSGPINNFKFYVSGTDNAEAQNDLYFNNLEVIPEPSAYGLILGALAMMRLARRR